MKFNVLQYLEEAVLASPNKIAYKDEHRSFTFREIKDLSYKVADAIYMPGASNMPIAVVMPKSALSVIAFLGSVYSGNFYAPVDPKFPKERLRAILEDLEAPFVLVDNTSEELARELGVKALKVINIQDVLNLPATNIDYAKFLVTKIDTDPLYCLYTSGSTGIPKGVLLPHRAIIDYLEYVAPMYQVNESTVIGSQAQFHFDLSVIDVFAPIFARSTTVIIPDNYFTFTSSLIQYMSDQQVNFICWAPAVLNYLSTRNILENKPQLNLKHILFCGEALPVKSLNYWRRFFPKATFVNLYGPTETTVSSTHYIISREFTEEEALPIGRADPNTYVFLLDIHDGVGEICIKGSSLALGYWNDLKKTEEKFIQNPLNLKYPERIYLTGDLGKLNDLGEIIYIGRKDNQIKHMGYRVELEEIERAVDKIDGIASSVVFYDQENKEIICAYGTLSLDLTEALIKKCLKNKLPVYMIPSRYIRYEHLPLSSRGKTDREKIKKIYYEKN